MLRFNDQHEDIRTSHLSVVVKSLTVSQSLHVYLRTKVTEAAIPVTNPCLLASQKVAVRRGGAMAGFIV